jgi:hypothetical protein
MIRVIVAVFVGMFQVLTVPCVFAAQNVGATQGAPTQLSKAELEKLVQPIALYPDLLLQQVLAASTFPEQVLDAAMYNEQGKDPAGIAAQPWDDSVKGVANYPSILVKLASDIDWTLTLGSAFINQNEQLRNAIQTMRARAKTVGNLNESEQQHVIEEQGADNTTIIRIEPANPQVVYVPATTTATVYEKPVSNSSSWLVPVASFGLGMAMGYAMGDDHDDHYYYGGGFYGPGFWYGGPAVNSWVDYRRDRWDDAYDFARDRQDWQQDNRDDWREYRQDLGRKQQEWNRERQARGTALTPEKRAEAQSRLTSARSAQHSGSLDQRYAATRHGEAANRVQSANFDRAAANQRLNDARTSGSFAERAKGVDRDKLNQRAGQVQSNPAVQQRAQASAASLSQKRSSGSYSAGGGLASMNRGQGSVNRASARGMASRASAGGFSRGGGGGRRR